MSHKVGIWIDHKKAVIVSASANHVTPGLWNLRSDLTPVGGELLFCAQFCDSAMLFMLLIAGLCALQMRPSRLIIASLPTAARLHRFLWLSSIRSVRARDTLRPWELGQNET